MTADPQVQLEAGQLALREGRWSAAKAAFEAALHSTSIAEAIAGIGVAEWWLGELQPAVTHLEQAYAAYRGQPEHTAAMALRLALIYDAHLLNVAMGAGWLARAARLIETHGLEQLRGELALTRACLTPDAIEGERLARAALALGQQTEDPDLELCALGQLGASLVEQGRIGEGTPLIDEAMAGCVGGEPRQVETVATVSCITLVACARCADFERALQSVRAMERFTERYGSPYHFAECRAIHAGILLATGHLETAERAIRAALELARGIPSQEARVLALLAQLRVMQGRLEEAGRLLTANPGHPDAVPVLAAIALRQGSVDLAEAILQRRLEIIGSTCLESGALLECLGLVELARAENHAAAARGRALAELGARLTCRILEARGERLWAKATARESPDAARQHFDAALAIFLNLGMRYEVARTRLDLAEVLREVHAELAAMEVCAGFEAFVDLGAHADADAAAALGRALGLNVTRRVATPHDDLSAREQEVLLLIAEGLGNPAIAQRLCISRKTVEHHVAHILQKLGVRSRAEAAAEAIRRQAAPRPR